MTPSIKFVDNESCYSVFRSVAEREYVVDITFREGITGLPGDRVMVVQANDYGIIVVELHPDTDEPMRNARCQIGYDEIDTLTIR